MSSAKNKYRIPMQVTHLVKFRASAYFLCPRCNVTLEREFAAYCDRCGQCLNWKDYKKAVVIRR